MPAALSDFTNVSDTSADLDDQWVVMARALQGLGCVFSAKIATGTEPSDVLHGLMLGIDAQSTTAKDWRIKVNSSNALVFDENTGTDGSPTWVTRATMAAGAAYAPSPSAHASSHQNGGSDEVATATPAANAIPKANGSGLLNSWIDDLARDRIIAGTVNRLAYNDGSTGLLSDLAAIAAAKVLVSDANGLPVAATPSTTEINYVAGVTSAIQTQLDARATLGTAQEFTAVKGSTESTPSSSSGAITFDFSASNYFEVTLTENITSITINNTSVPGPRTIKFAQSSANTYTVTGWPSTKWINAAAPVITTGANAVDYVTLYIDSAGAKFGTYAQAFA